MTLLAYYDPLACNLSEAVSGNKVISSPDDKQEA